MTGQIPKTPARTISMPRPPMKPQAPRILPSTAKYLWPPLNPQIRSPLSEIRNSP